MFPSSRPVRPTVLLAALCLLTVPAAVLGQDASSASREARPVSMVEGVVSQIESLPTPGSKPILRLLDGLVAVDTAGAKVQDFYGEALGLEAVRVGSRVIASVTPPATAGQPLAAQVILVAALPNEGVLNGAVEAVDAGAGTFRLLGATVRTTAETKWPGGAAVPAPGNPATGTRGIQDLKVADQVLVLVRSESGALVARRVQVMTSVPTVDVVRVSGTVKAIGPTGWTVTAEGKDVALVVNERTRIAGDPQIGDKVEVLAQRDAAGALVALVIAKTSITPPPVPDLARFRGTVRSIATSAWVITSEGKDLTVGIVAETRITGSPQVGDTVEVLARKDAAGALVGVLIANVGTRPVVDVVRVSGTVTSTSATVWVITTSEGDKRLGITSETKLVGDPKVGDRVEALAQQSSGGVLVAVVIAKVSIDPMPPQLTSFEGTVRSITDDVWAIDGVKVMTNRTTVFRGDPKVEDRVRVTGKRMPAGSSTGVQFVATEIAKI